MMSGAIPPVIPDKITFDSLPVKNGNTIRKVTQLVMEEKNVKTMNEDLTAIAGKPRNGFIKILRTLWAKVTGSPNQFEHNRQTIKSQLGKVAQQLHKEDNNIKDLIASSRQLSVQLKNINLQYQGHDLSDQIDDLRKIIPQIWLEKLHITAAETGFSGTKQEGLNFISNTITSMQNDIFSQLKAYQTSIRTSLQREKYLIQGVHNTSLASSKEIKDISKTMKDTTKILRDFIDTSPEFCNWLKDSK